MIWRHDADVKHRRRMVNSAAEDPAPHVGTGLSTSGLHYLERKINFRSFKCLFPVSVTNINAVPNGSGVVCKMWHLHRGSMLFREHPLHCGLENWQALVPANHLIQEFPVASERAMEQGFHVLVCWCCF